MFKKFLFIAFLLTSFSLTAQTTTSSLSGNVTDGKEAIIAATITATHGPSGTRYFSTSDLSGNFSMRGMRVGGPYTLEISYIGYRPLKTEGITLRLGEDYVLKVKLEESTEQLDEIVVQASKNSIINSKRTGASTNVSSRELQSLPTVSRSLTDFTRMTPQANGNSFGGRDGRFNRVTIDGAAFNNNFGLSSDLMPGGSAQPVSLEAIEEVSVNLAPYDVRMSQFTGASINAVTKSGGNKVTGSAYTFLRPKTFTGQRVAKDTVRNARERQAQTYGFTVGGPIIKNKLFFFVNAEYEQTVLPSGSWEPSLDGKGNKEKKISRTTEADLETVSQHLKTKYDYDAGKYKNFDNFKEQNYKILAKIDWNINDKNKFSLRYNTLRNSSDEAPNKNSGPARIRSSGRNSKDNVSFSNSYFGSLNKVDAVSAELNSVFTKQASNRILVSYTATADVRTSKSKEFPFVDIFKDEEHYISFGYELFSYNNVVKNNTFSIQDNFTYKLGDHTLTAGLAYDNIFVANNFTREGTSYYRYNSLEQFLNDEKPTVFGMTYGYNNSKPQAVDLSFGLASAYLQDEFRINEQLKITAGVRFDLPIYHNKLKNNPAVDDLPALSGYKMNIATWPKSKLMINPRVGFNWDVKGDRSIQMRGGTGLFSGVLPFVWFTNQPTGSGAYQSPETIFQHNPDPDPAKHFEFPDDFKFNPDGYNQIAKYPDMFPQKPGEGIGGAVIAEVNKNFRMPQIWRSNLAADFMLPYNMVLTLEGVFSKDINAIFQRDLNLPASQSILKGADQRPFWTNNKITNLNRAMLLDNTDKGYQGSLTTQLVKNFSNGLSGMLAYTYTTAKDITSNPGSSAHSAFENNSVYTDPNSPELSYSQFAVPHRVVGSLSYRFEYAKHFATTVSLFYTGSHQGRYTYLVKGDWKSNLNNDGMGNDLMFVPKTVSDFNFVLLTDKDKDGNIISTTSPKEQLSAFETYINEEPYLKTRKGKYAERNGGLRPWFSAIDMKIAQDIFSNFGTSNKYTLQLTLDIKNVANLLSPNWGVRKTSAYADQYGTILPLSFKGLDTDGVPQYTLNAKNIKDFEEKTSTINNVSISSTWGILFGLRLLF